MIPYLLQELQTATPGDRAAILLALRRLGPETVPPLAAALDSNDAALQEDLIDLFVKHGAREVVPYLWPLAGNPKRPERCVRRLRRRWNCSSTPNRARCRPPRWP